MMDSEGHTRHFPPPWCVEDNGACFIIRDHGSREIDANVLSPGVAIRGRAK
jgi:hypothetical protein